jgi:Ca-activated chloride channel family protein
MDSSTFREKVQQNQKIAESDLTYEGFFHEYFFDISSNSEPTNKFFQPVYSSALCINPLSDQREVYLSVGLRSNMEISEMKRPDMDFIIILE